MSEILGGPTGTGAEPLPARVEAASALFRRQGVWHLLSRNSPATSCRDAASRRRRLGTEGIPLYDELKSLCVAAYLPDGGRSYVLLHCRAHRRLDLEAARQLLGAVRPLARLGNDELEERFATRYGTVNPFSEPERFVQVFDQGLLDEYTPPHTMMTNGGDLTWAVEFRPPEVIEALRRESPRVLVGSITGGAGGGHRLPAFGIITGNGPDSGIALWQHLNARINERLTAERRMRGDLSYPRVLVQSLPEMGLSMELREREEEVWEVIRKAVEGLMREQVDHIAIACNTTQYFAERIRALCKPEGVEFVAIADLLADHIRRAGVQDLTILGIPVVADMDEYSGFRALRELGVRAVDPGLLTAILELGYMVKRLGHSAQDNKALNKLQHVLRSGVETDGVIIALTEISILLAPFPKLRGRIGDKRIIDTLRLLGEALGDRYLEALPDERGDDADLW